MKAQNELTGRREPCTFLNASVSNRLGLCQTELDRTLADADHQCSVYTSFHTLKCDELWTYDDRRKIQKLVGLRALCALRHHVKHFGHAARLVEAGSLEKSTLIQHCLTANQCDIIIFEEHCHRVFALWKERSKHTWTADFGAYMKDAS